MTDDEVIALLPTVGKSFSRSTTTHIELTDPALAAVGLTDPEQLRRVTERLGGWVERLGVIQTASVGGPPEIEPSGLGYWLPRTAL